MKSQILLRLEIVDESPNPTSSKFVAVKVTNNASNTVEPIGKELSQKELLTLLPKRFDRLNSRFGKYKKLYRDYKNNKERKNSKR